jgi:hypothetical protein
MKYFFIFVWICQGIFAHSQLNVEVQPDGKRYSKILLSGGISQKYDLVFIGDGFTNAEQKLFNLKVNQAVSDIQRKNPFNQSMCSFNIWRVNLISAESGISDPNINRVRRTELGCRFGDRKKGEIERCIYVPAKSKCFDAAAIAPEFDAVIVLVNDMDWGGCESDVVFCTIAPNFTQIVTHEMGHKIADLADEYTCRQCDGPEPPARYRGPEPAQVNLTIERTQASIKWTGLINASTLIPTLMDQPPGVVGLFEGGGYFSNGIYRPQKNCHMRKTPDEFCVVCRNEMLRRLRLYCAGP